MKTNTVTGDMRDYPVQSKPCLTCPFEGKEPLQLSANSMARYVKNLMGEGQHICHSSSGTRMCKGGEIYNYNTCTRKDCYQSRPTKLLTKQLMKRIQEVNQILIQ